MKGYGRIFTIGAISVGIVLFTFLDLRISGSTRASSLYGNKGRFTSLFTMPRAGGPEHDKAAEKEQRRGKRYLEMKEKLGDMERRVADMRASLDQIEKEDDSHSSAGKTEAAAASEKADGGGRPPAINRDLVPKFPDFKAGTKNGSRVPSVLSRRSGGALEGNDAAGVRAFDSEASFKNYGKAPAPRTRLPHDGIIGSHTVPLSRADAVNSILRNASQNAGRLPSPAGTPGALPDADASASESFGIKPTLTGGKRPGAWRSSAARRPETRAGDEPSGSGRDLDAEVLEGASKMQPVLQESPVPDGGMRRLKGASSRKSGQKAGREHDVSSAVTVFCEGYSDPKKAFSQGVCVFRAEELDPSASPARQDAPARGSAQNETGSEGADKMGVAFSKYLSRSAEGGAGGLAQPEEKAGGMKAEAEKIVKRGEDSHEAGLRRDRKMRRKMKEIDVDGRILGKIEKMDRILGADKGMDEKIDDIVKEDRKISKMLQRKLRDSKSTEGVFAKEADSKAGVQRAENGIVGSEGGQPKRAYASKPGAGVLPKGDFSVVKGPEFAGMRQTVPSAKNSPVFGSDSSRDDFEDESTYSSSEFGAVSPETASAPKPVFKFLSGSELSKRAGAQEDMGMDAAKREGEKDGVLGADRPAAGADGAASEKTAKPEKMNLD